MWQIPRARFSVAGIVVTVLTLAGCSGSTTGATNVGVLSATLTAQASCSGGTPYECSWYWEWGTGSKTWTSQTFGPVATTWSGQLTYNVTGLDEGYTYHYDLCGMGDSVSTFVCVGPSYFTTATVPNGRCIVSANPPTDSNGTLTPSAVVACGLKEPEIRVQIVDQKLITGGWTDDSIHGPYTFPAGFPPATTTTYTANSAYAHCSGAWHRTIANVWNLSTGAFYSSSSSGTDC